MGRGPLVPADAQTSLTAPYKSQGYMHELEEGAEYTATNTTHQRDVQMQPWEHT